MCKVAPYTRALSSAEAPAGYPYKKSNDQKNGKRARYRAPRALFFFFPASPQHKEASAEERDAWAIRMENSKFVIQKSVRGVLREALSVVI